MWYPGKVSSVNRGTAYSENSDSFREDLRFVGPMLLTPHLPCLVDRPHGVVQDNYATLNSKP